MLKSENMLSRQQHQQQYRRRKLLLLLSAALVCQSALPIVAKSAGGTAFAFPSGQLKNFHYPNDRIRSFDSSCIAVCIGRSGCDTIRRKESWRLFESPIDSTDNDNDKTNRDDERRRISVDEPSSSDAPRTIASKILETTTPSRKFTSRNKLVRLITNFKQAAEEGFGTKARNVASTLTVGDVVVPLVGNLRQRQWLANRGVYAGVDYLICSLYLPSKKKDDTTDYYPLEVTSLDGIPASDKNDAIAYIKPAYPLRPHLERSDWPVPVKPLEDVPLWLSQATYQAGTALGTAALSLSILAVASFFALFIRFAYVPSESMIPTLYPGDVVLVTRSVNNIPFLKPKVGDVVFFDPPEELDQVVANSMVGGATGDGSRMAVTSTQGKQFLKRVVGVPGDRVGVHRSEPYVALDPNTQVLSKEIESSGEQPTTTTTSSSFSLRDVKRIDLVGPHIRPDIFSPDCWERPPSLEPLKKNEYFVVGDNGFRSVDSRVWGPLKDRYIFGTAKWVVYPPQHFGPLEPGNIVSGGTSLNRK